MVSPERIGLALEYVELRGPELLLIGVLPDEEDFVDRVQGVDLELVITISAVDEYFDVIFLENRRVAFRQSGGDERFLDPEADVEITIVP